MANSKTTARFDESEDSLRFIEMPAPTAWPFVLAFGCALCFAGLVTSVSVSLLGTLLAVAGCVGWLGEVFPHQHEALVQVVPRDVPVTTHRLVVERLSLPPQLPRAWLPVRTYPISCGVKGGLAGSVAMAALACGYGLVKAGSPWYPINLLAAAVYSQSVRFSNGELYSFHADSFAIAVGLHVVVSTLVGVLYGAMLPMFPGRPIVLGGLVAPPLWSGLLYSILGLLNPLLAARIDWPWFVASQAAFGIVAGFVVMGQSRVTTRENLPFAIRAGIEAAGVVLPATREGRS